jgi:hypothetical protein
MKERTPKKFEIQKRLQLMIISISIICLLSQFVHAQNNVTTEQTKVQNYLQSYFEKRKNGFAPLYDEFAEFLPIERDLEKDLLKNFPQHKFFIAKTYYSHWVWRDNESKILVVTNSENGEPIGHRWALWYSGFSESFSHILEGYSFNSNDDAKEKVILLSKLMVSIGRDEGKIGEVKFIKKEITVDLDTGFRTMKVKYNKGRFGKITFINPYNCSADSPEKLFDVKQTKLSKNFMKSKKNKCKNAN